MAVAIYLLLAAVASAAAQEIPSADDSRHGMLRAAMLGLLTPAVTVSEADATKRCLELPAAGADDRLEGPHEGTLTSTRCVVRAYEHLSGRWTYARYQWTSIFSGAGNGPITASEEEAVLFDIGSASARAIWHERYEVGSSGPWRSITPNVAPVNGGGTLLSIMSCVNGTGGCSQEFLNQHADRRWFPVEQQWLDQLPNGFAGRILHGVQIDPLTLRGDAGFYGDSDPNCCPSRILIVELALRGDALVLVRHRLTTAP